MRKNGGSMAVRIQLLEQSTNETLERTTGEQQSGLDPSWRFLQTAHLGANVSDDQQQVSLSLIFIYWRLSVQFVTTTSQFTLSERNGLVYKPHPRFLAQNLSKKVRLIHESLR